VPLKCHRTSDRLHGPTFRKTAYIIIIIIINLVITFLQGIYNYIPEPTMLLGYSVAAVLQLQFVLHAMLFPVYFNIGAFRNVCAVPNITVFCSSLMPGFHGIIIIR
jgi:hypothetical protein